MVTTPSLTGAGTFGFDGGNGERNCCSRPPTRADDCRQHLRSHADGSGTVRRIDGTLINNGLLVADATHSLTVTGDIGSATAHCVDGGYLQLNGTVTGIARYTREHQERRRQRRPQRYAGQYRRDALPDAYDRPLAELRETRSSVSRSTTQAKWRRCRLRRIASMA